MEEINFLFIGWCQEEKNGVKSDKVWCAFRAGSTYYAGWGARGKTLRFKDHGKAQYNTLNKVIRTKQKEYTEVDKFHLFTVFPDFADDVQKHLCMSLLTNTVK
jgi:hypothetical protein